MREKENLTLLGNQQTEYSMDYNPSVLEAFQNKHPENDYFVKFNCPEFTSLCPITGQPDFATITISYVPDERLVESKSLKLYLFSFRNHGDFHEDVINIIMKDLVKLLERTLDAGLGAENLVDLVRLHAVGDQREFQRELGALAHAALAGEFLEIPEIGPGRRSGFQRIRVIGKDGRPHEDADAALGDGRRHEIGLGTDLAVVQFLVETFLTAAGKFRRFDLDHVP